MYLNEAEDAGIEAAEYASLTLGLKPFGGTRVSPVCVK